MAVLERTTAPKRAGTCSFGLGDKFLQLGAAGDDLAILQFAADECLGSPRKQLPALFTGTIPAQPRNFLNGCARTTMVGCGRLPCWIPCGVNSRLATQFIDSAGKTPTREDD